MASEAEEKRCPHGVHQMQPFYDRVGMTLILSELTPEQILKLGHDTPPAPLVSGMHELLWEAHEQLSQHGLAAASVASLFEDEELQVEPQTLPQVSPGTMSRYLNIGARLVHFILLLDALPAPEPSSFLSQVLASRGEAITTAALAVQDALDAGLSGEDLVEPLAALWLALVNAELHLFDNDKVHFVNVFLLCTAVSKGSGVLQDIRRWTTTLAGLIYIFKLFLLRFGKAQRWATAGKLRPFLQSGRLVHFLSQRMTAARSSSTADGQVGVDIDVQTDGDMTDEALHTIVCQGTELNVKEIGTALVQMRNDMKEILDTHLLLGSDLRERHALECVRLRSKEDRTNRVKNCRQVEALLSLAAWFSVGQPSVSRHQQESRITIGQRNFLLKRAALDGKFCCPIYGCKKRYPKAEGVRRHIRARHMAMAENTSAELGGMLIHSPASEINNAPKSVIGAPKRRYPHHQVSLGKNADASRAKMYLESLGLALDEYEWILICGKCAYALSEHPAQHLKRHCLNVEDADISLAMDLIKEATPRKCSATSARNCSAISAKAIKAFDSA
ncbi:uncharacterized protein MONBRDRAFT_13105, partial [Monosiga brevicollis MX1]